jgi:hypothetical protein
LSPTKVIVASARIAAPSGYARVGAQSRRDVEREDGPGRAIHRMDEVCGASVDRTREPGAEDRVDDHFGALEQALVPIHHLPARRMEGVPRDARVTLELGGSNSATTITCIRSACASRAST